ncbi:sigma-70 family RNA polymerase sigma factor [Pantoea sp. Al-1710]|uniref:Sigma-70 family RNA polymerase sigma factor n=1 Tax=Candidatus Pantoea communis TaxID=2608354 RepID=A0ABX0RI97_9GAMM|nr:MULTISPECIES: sigma-70 family RNA polymerase sigma factor [Pantoea]NIG12929.1 sigma-70 family RNA polymerase sigma factor [Pantoea sp. Cy-640]NIG17370.1 sigma-70 family RNA polymerase sigma factor [Pantoea communis]
MVALYADMIEHVLIDWETVMKETEKRLHNFIRKRVSNFADVDDLVQTTWLEVLIHKGRFKGHARPETWIFGIAMNLVKIYYKDSRLRAYNTAPVESMENEHNPKDEPEIILEGRKNLSLAIENFKKMPEEYQKLLTVLIENDVGYQELADTLSIPIGTVRSRLSRLRAFLKKEMRWEA